MLLLKLLGKAIGCIVESTSTGGLQIALLSLILGLLVGIHEVAIAVSIALLCTPDFLLMDRLWEGGRRGRVGTTVVLELLPVTTTVKPKCKVEAVALLRLLRRRLLLLLVVHGGETRVWRSQRGGEASSVGGVLWRPVVGGCCGEGCVGELRGVV